MRYILLPIHPEWCCKLMNGDKETEIRRGTALYNAIDKLIKEQGKAPCLIYCTRGKPTLLPKNKYRPRFMVAPYGNFERNPLNGKVVAMFEAEPDRIFNVRYGADEDECAKEHVYETSLLGREDLERSSCLEYDQLLKYLGEEWDDGYIGTAIHVKSGTMRTDGFPKDLSDYGVRKAPQSFVYVEVEE